MKVYQIRDKNDPDCECVMYTSLEWAVRDFRELLENLDTDCPVQWTITITEMTQEEWAAVPTLDR